MIDVAKIRVIAGAGGNGCVSFRRTRAQPKGGPDGGDGGRGGNVSAAADPSLNTLLHLRYQQTFKGGRGRHGGGKDKIGARGEDLTVMTPPGTLIWRREEGGSLSLVGDVLDEEPMLIARGGGGGRGNSRFVNSVNRTPLLAEAGAAGESLELVCELKLLADVGIVGMPNAGKSTILSRCSGARPKVAGYPFTTLSPELGVVASGLDTFLLVEIPGLIEGAHQGVGLGHDFLRHVARTRLLWHLVDGAADDVVARMELINRELSLYNQELGHKPQMLVVNKADAMPAKRKSEIQEVLRPLNTPYFMVSAMTGEGIPALVDATMKALKDMPSPVGKGSMPEAGPKVHRPKPRRNGPTVYRDEKCFVVEHTPALRLLAMVNLKDRRVQLQLWREFKRMGVAKELERAGIQAGDTVRLGKVELEWE